MWDVDCVCVCQLCFWPAEYRSTNPRAGIIQSHFPVVCTGTWHVPGPSCATLCFLVGTCHVLVHLVLIHYSKKVLPVRNLSGFWTASSMFGKTCVPTVWLFAVLFLLCVQLVCTSPYIFFPRRCRVCNIRFLCLNEVICLTPPTPGLV